MTVRTLGIPLCPTCGERCNGFDTDTDFREVFPQEEMWPGGPKIEATWLPPRLVSAGSRFTFHPCGHVLPAAGLQVTCVPPNNP